MDHLDSFGEHPSTLALYLHIPYCRRRCSYCDFNAHQVPGEEQQAFEDYAQALRKDIETQRPGRVSTVFWGGGTPSLMPLDVLRGVVESLAQKFSWEGDLENTLEANPGTLTPEKLAGYLSLGINRLSVGAQSFLQRHLELVGRIHSPDQIEACVRMARAAGFENISLDLIYGFPEQSVEQWRHSLEQALALEPQHLSVYQLTVEPFTRLESQLAAGELELPPEDEMIAMDDLAEAVLSRAGFRRYEISNWARPGYECRHNLRYWSDSPYLGLGCGAVSFLGGWRFERIKPPVYYQRALREGRSPVVFAERRGADGALKDHLMMGLRVKGGVSWAALAHRYPGLTREQLVGFFERLPRSWWEERTEGFELTRRGWDFHSEVTMELMDVMFSF